ncbi:hypothetical protein FA95DRAFT_1562990 [Auriscalpium vulgare]|uniref:Uncharacterized protein n=1 Tax=Auriscalpium vulgare TaxID=40419 RepID=A0ACB8RHX5_9AGAM|nr:hypothetical protein FA95DRAFT_1562990 [Auriscalpium vulgare]
MPSIEETQINRITDRVEIRVKAKALLQTLRVKTGPGTGYELGPGKTGLAAICAYLASVQLGFSDVPEDVAQKAACLQPKIWRAALTTAQKALDPPIDVTAGETREQESLYAKFVRDYRIGRVGRVANWMDEVETELLQNKTFRKEFDIAADNPVFRPSVFFWVGTRVLKLNAKISAEPLSKKYNVSFKTLSQLVQFMDERLHVAKERLLGAVNELRRAKGAPKPAPAPTASRPASPTKSALRASGTPSVAGGTKRKVAFSAATSDDEEDEGFVPDTPSKRPRMSSSPVKYKTPRTLTREQVFPLDMKTPIPPPVLQGVASSSKLVQDYSASEVDESSDAMDVDVESEPASEPEAAPVAGPSTPRRARAQPIVAAEYTPRPRRKEAPKMHEVILEDDEDEDEEEEEDALPASRRFRPVLLDRAQWAQRAPRLMRQRAAAERSKRALVERWGHPFEALRVVEAAG